MTMSTQKNWPHRTWAPADHKENSSAHSSTAGGSVHLWGLCTWRQAQRPPSCLCVKSVSKRCKLERRPSKCCLTHAGWCCKPTLLWVSVTVRAADRRRTLQRNRQTTRDAGVHRRLVAQFIHESDEWKKRSCVTERRGWRGRSPAVREMDEETQTGFTASCKSCRYVAI